MSTATAKAEVDAIVNRPYGIELEYPEDPKDGILAYVVEWPNCFAAGATREEAIQELDHAMRAMVAFHLERGLEVPEPSSRYGGTVVVQMPKSLHRRVMTRAKREGVSMNQFIATTLAEAIGPVSHDAPRHEGRATVLGVGRKVISKNRRALDRLA